MTQFRRIFITEEQFKKAQISYVSLFVNNGTPRILESPKVHISSMNIPLERSIVKCDNDIYQLITKDFKGTIIEKISVKLYRFEVIHDDNSLGKNYCNDKIQIDSASIKKTVRIDDDLYRALFNEAFFNEDNGEVSFNKLINNSVLKRLESREINLLDAQSFTHRITIHFSLEDYFCIQNTVYYLKEIIGLKWITFSLVVRSMLYESLHLVREVYNPVLLKDLSSVA